MNLKELSLDELKSAEFNILKYIDFICKENKINYSLAGGTLLGAVRHKGFIPWDDDIDILMVRDQYEKFIKIFESDASEKYRLITYKNNKNFNYLFAKVVDTSTRLIEEHNKSVDSMGVFVDIFPIDTIGCSKKESIEKFRKIKIKKYIIVASNWKHYYFNKNHGLFRQFPRFFFYLVSRFVSPKKVLGSVEMQFPFNSNMAYWGSVPGVYGNREIMRKDVFCHYDTLKFEKQEFMVLKSYDEYLRNLYGDYMKLPPKEKRIANHTFKAFNKIESNKKVNHIKGA